MGTKIDDLEEEAREIRRQLKALFELREQHRKRGLEILLDNTIGREERHRTFDALSLTQISQDDENKPTVFNPGSGQGMSLKEVRG